MEMNTADELKEEMLQAQAIMKILHKKLRREPTIDEDHKESIAYRLAEIMAGAKSLYTKILPKLSDEETGMFELLSEFRLHYMNLIDIIEEFDELFLTSIVKEEGASLNPDGEEEESFEEALDRVFEEDGMPGGHSEN